MERESKHIITFLKRLKAFSQKEGITSLLQVDKDNTVEDVLNCADTTGGVIAEIDNAVGEIMSELWDYYEKTGNKRLLKRLKKLYND